MSDLAVRYFAALDIEPAQDLTALAMRERGRGPRTLMAPAAPVAPYAVRHLERFPLGTPYTQVGSRLAG